MMTRDAKAQSLMTAEERGWVGTPCQCCGKPLTAVSVFIHGGSACGPCQTGESQVDRLPSATVVGLILALATA